MDPVELTKVLGRPPEHGPLEPHSAERERQDARALRAAEAARTARGGGSLSWLLEGGGWPFLRPVLDGLALVLSVLVVLWWDGDELTSGAKLGLVIFPPVVMLLLALRGMYVRHLRVSILDGVAPVVSAVSLGAIILVGTEVTLLGEELGTSVLLHLWALGLLTVGVGRIAAAGAQRYARVRELVGRTVIIVGAGEVGAKVAQRLLENPSYGLRPVGFLDDDPPEPGAAVAGLPVLGGLHDVDWIASLAGAEHVVLAFSRLPDNELVLWAQRCAHFGLEVSIVPRLYEAVNDRLSYEAIGGMPLMALRPTRPLGFSFAAKHGIDRLVAGIAILLLSPLLVALALGVKLTSRGPITFSQRRVGYDGAAFDLLKFRSMRAARPGEGFELASGSAPGGVEGVDRRTAIGRFLRRSSLDELPQLFNVLRGDMSLVGPRPERPEFVELFTQDIKRYAERHRVRSGITGWAQVHGLRGQTSLADRVEWDNYYIEHWSPKLDLKIIALTVLAVLRKAE